MKYLIILLFPLLSYTQDYPGEFHHLLIGKTIKVDTLDKRSIKKGYRGFYKSYNSDEHLTLSKDHLFPITIGNIGRLKIISSDYNKLLGMQFVVKNTIDFDEKNAILELYNEKVGAVFYDYNKDFRYAFHFKVIDGLEVPNNLFCEKLKTEKDKFTDEIHIKSPVEERISFHKINNDYYIMLLIYNSDLEAGNKGAILLLSDGSKIIRKDVDIETDVYGQSSYRYSCFFKLTKSETLRLAEFEITDYRLFIFDWEISPYQRIKYLNYMKCILNN